MEPGAGFGRRRTSMRLSLAPHVRLAAVGDDLVFLDILGDAYFCAPDGGVILRPDAQGHSLAPVEAEDREALLASGLVVLGPPTARPALARPARDLPHGDGPRLSWRDRWRLAGATWDLFRRYRGRAFVDILAYVVAAAPIDALPSEDILRLAQVFHRVAPWLPIPDKCLARSFVLLRFLQRSGGTARWVFAVRTWPFAAHCWLQVGEVALDDASARLVAFEPIHAVG